MFDFHRRDPRKTVSAALQTADLMSQHGCGRDPRNSSAIDRAQRLYDLTIALHELHENVANQSISMKDLDHALALNRRIGQELLHRHPEFAPHALIGEGMWALKGMLEIAAGGEDTLLGSKQGAHAAVRLLQNELHNVYLRWAISRSLDKRRRARSNAMKGIAPVHQRKTGDGGPRHA